jgi:hypothetical protein
MKKNNIHPPRVSASVIEIRLGASVVWLIFVGQGLNIWPVGAASGNGFAD